MFEYNCKSCGNSKTSPFAACTVCGCHTGTNTVEVPVADSFEEVLDKVGYSKQYYGCAMPTIVKEKEETQSKENHPAGFYEDYEDSYERTYDTLAPIKEETPDGKRMHEAGAKCDKGKNRISFVLDDFAHAIEAVCRVGTDGAEKYTDSGWKEVDNGVQRYEDAMLRHHFKIETEGAYDRETNMLHAIHRLWNDMAALELILLELKKKEKD